MKKLIAPLLTAWAVIFGIASTSTAQKGVEVAVLMRTAMTGDQAFNMHIFTKGGHTITQMDMGAMGNIKCYIDKKNKKITILGVGQNLEMDMLDNSPQDAKGIEMKPTGKKDVINGFKSEEYTLTLDKGQMADAWLTNDLPKSVFEHMKDMQLSSAGSSGNMSTAVKKMMEKGMFFSRLIMNTPQGGDVTMDVTKVEEKDLDDAMFKVPADAHPKHVDQKMLQRMQGH